PWSRRRSAAGARRQYRRLPSSSLPYKRRKQPSSARPTYCRHSSWRLRFRRSAAGISSQNSLIVDGLASGLADTMTGEGGGFRQGGKKLMVLEDAQPCKVDGHARNGIFIRPRRRARL